MQTVKDAVNYVSESVQGAGATASKEGNKEIAKGNTGADAGTRLTAAKDAISDKIDESSHNAKADLHKEKAKN